MILIVCAHPYLHRSHANKTILDSISKKESVVVNDLYQKYPDFHINIAQEQSLLLQAELIVFQFPLYWYSVPALMKQWQEVVLTRQFSLADGALQGKSVIVVVTTGHQQQTYQPGGYNNYSLDDFLRPLEQMSIHCGMQYHSPLALYQAHKTVEIELTQFTELVSQRIDAIYQQVSHCDE